MSYLFDRFASLIVGKSGEEGLLFEDFRISWDIVKDSESNPNTSKISIFNLNKTSRSLLQEEKIFMILNVGYLGRPELVGKKIIHEPIKEILFTGDVKKASTKKQGPDFITTLEGGDGAIALQDKNIDESFGPNTPVTSVFDKLIDKLGVPKGTIKGISAESILNGLALSGQAKSELDKLTAKQGLEWSIQDGELQILPKDKGTDQEAIILTPETGLLGSPIKKNKGMEFEALLNPQIKVGRVVQIISRDVNGFFICKKCTYKGDNREGSNTVKVEAAE